jgi:hypothetical protein
MEKMNVCADFVQAAKEAVETPELVEILKRLAAHGLGVFVPHVHTPDGHFAPLPSGTVALETNLHVYFVNATDSCLADAVAVGWVWDESIRQVMECKQCSATYHH